MTTGDATIKKALVSQDDLIARREHCSVDARLLGSVETALGQQIRLRRTATEYALFTVSQRRDVDAADVVRLGLAGRQAPRHGRRVRRRRRASSSRSDDVRQ